MLRSPRSWSDATSLFGGGLTAPPDTTRWGLNALLSALGAADQARAAEEIQAEFRKAQQAQRQDVQGARRDMRRERTMARHAGGSVVQGPSTRGAGSGQADRIVDAVRRGGAGRLSGAQAGIPRGVTVPDHIKKLNPNIDRALNFDISNTNPHAAALADGLAAGGQRVPRGVADSLAEALRGGQRQMPTQDAIRALVERQMPGGMRREAGGSNPLADQIASAARQASVPKPGATTPATGMAPRLDQTQRLTPQQQQLRPQLPNPQAGAAPTADSIAATVRSRLGAGDVGNLAQDTMQQVMTAVGQQRGVGGVPNADALVQAIRAQAMQQANAAAQRGVTPAGQGGLMPQPQTAMPPSPPNGGMSAPWPNIPGTIQPTSDILPAGLGGTGDVRPGKMTPMADQIAAANQAVNGTPAGGLRAMPDSGFQDPRMSIAANPNSGSGVTGSDPNLNGAAQMIIQQETGGAEWTPNNVNCTIRPESGCLDLNTGIFKLTADSMGLDWNRLMTDPSYAPQAVGQLLSGYANDDASAWGGPAGMTVWEWGNQNLPGGGWEAVGRIYFGGCVTNGCFVDEQGRSVDTYGQQFVAKLQQAGVTTGPGLAPPGAAPTGTPTPGATGVPGVGANAPAGGPAIPGSDIYVPGGGPIPQQPANGGLFPGASGQIDLTQQAIKNPDGTYTIVPSGRDGTTGEINTSPDPSVPGPDPRTTAIYPVPGNGDVAIDANANIAINTANSAFPESTPNTEPRAVWTPQTTSYLDALFPGAGQATYDNNYGFKSDGPAYYCRYLNWECTKHSGIDIPTGGQRDINSLVDGRVICYGGASSAANPGVGCGSYPDEHGGINQISILEDNGAVVVYGHMNSSYYGLDQQVQAGTPVGVSGKMVIEHVHLDVLLPIGPNGEYYLVDPNLYFGNHYCDRGFCAY